ncbi:hypothetical protein L0666_01670 [Octadecabacter sp. CECT 8868]|uniref:hypothetical protein n=1 Tax=Octadecabacter algicola TaxID=2909342 RepID=UPI001F3ED531|nr:hypothetical protein [Octadecabacter algicola]MCF2903683.1 hypothetical protein [Octadecabacter algicola]
MKPFRNILAAAVLFGAAPACAEDYAGRHIALSQAFQTEMGRTIGGGADMTISADMRAQMVCAIGQLEQRRGAQTVEAYLRWSAWAVDEAKQLDSIGGFGSLMSQVHIRSDIDLNDDLVPITQACGIGL